MPALESIEICGLEWFDEQPLPIITTLTQPTLTALKREDKAWHQALNLPPETTLNQLTSITLRADDEVPNFVLESFVRPLEHLHNLTFFSLVGDRVDISCRDLGHILGCIPGGKLERLHISIIVEEQPGEYELLRRALGMQRRLRDVHLCVSAEWGATEGLREGLEWDLGIEKIYLGEDEP
ncbi:hypothetical protein HDV00_007149 [Rhizophlyctis rosea]|nr:hypothetical protein HDV00_007149 [Rhizophlyctis rosea]